MQTVFKANVLKGTSARLPRRANKPARIVASATAEKDGFKLMRDGIKVTLD